MFQSSTHSYEQHQYNRLRCDASYFELLLYTYMCCSEAILLFLWNKAMSEPLLDYSCGGGGCGWLPCLTDVGSIQSKQVDTGVIIGQWCGQ